MFPCNHAIGRATILRHIEYLISIGNYEVRCPIVVNEQVCNQVWQKKLWQLVAGYTERQMGDIEAQMSKNMVRRHSKQCPYCGSSVCSIGLETNRVKCPSCTNSPDFCFICLEPWKTTNSAICNSEACRFRRECITNSPLQRQFRLYRKG